MIDQPFGLGAIESPPDQRDFPISLLYDQRQVALTPVAAIPTAFGLPAPLPPVFDQDGTPQCVAFSSEFLKSFEDRRDQAVFFNFDTASFFTGIGGGPNGAVVRTAFAYMLHTGYPLVGNAAAASQHKIAAYYAVSKDQASIQQALMAFGPLVAAMPWYNSWFHPVSGVLPTPDTAVGGHAIAVVGWDARGLRLRNSWGTDWGLGGDCFLPWAYLPRTWEFWKAVDVIEAPPVPKPSVVLKYGGYAGFRGTWRVNADHTNERRTPYITSTNVIRQVNAGTIFVNAQTTDKGTIVNGSARWLGSADGNTWIHVSTVTLVK